MHATGLNTTQPAYNRGLLRVLLAAVALAFVVTLLIVATAGRISIASPAAADPNVLTPSQIQFFADERSEMNGNSGSVIRVQPDGRAAAPGVANPRSGAKVAN
jgi:hypothetical protein